jgi:hypothetical protein
MKQQGLNDLPRTLTTTPYDLLRAISRPDGREGKRKREREKERKSLNVPEVPIVANVASKP